MNLAPGSGDKSILGKPRSRRQVMRKRFLLTTSLVAAVVAAMGILAIETASAGFRAGPGMGAHGFGMARGFSGRGMGMPHSFGGRGMGSVRGFGPSGMGVPRGAVRVAPPRGLRGPHMRGAEGFEASRTRAPRGESRKIHRSHSSKPLKSRRIHPDKMEASRKVHRPSLKISHQEKFQVRAKGDIARRGGLNDRRFKNALKDEPQGATLYDPKTGHTTTGVINKDGSFTKTVTDRNGKSVTTIIPKPKRGPTGISVPDGKGGYKPFNPPPKEPEGGTFYDPKTGRTTTGVFNKDGSITKTVTDGDGKATTTVIPKPVRGPTGISVPDGKGGYKPYNPPRRNPRAGRSTIPRPAAPPPACSTKTARSPGR